MTTPTARSVSTGPAPRARTAPHNRRDRTAPCPNCGGRTRDGHLCRTCTQTTEQRLQALPGWWVELQRTITRQTRLSAQGGARDNTRPLPFNPEASQVADRIRHGVTTPDTVRKGLAGWVRVTVDDLAAARPSSGVTDMCEHLAGALPLLRKHDKAAEFAADVWAWTDAISRAVDYPDVRARIKAGPCPEVDDEREPCAGTVWAIIPQDEHADVFAGCDTCPEDSDRGVWPSSQWRKMARRIGDRQAQIEAQKTRPRRAG